MSLRERVVEEFAGDLEYHPKRGAIYLGLGLAALGSWILAPASNRLTTVPLVFAFGSLALLLKGAYLFRKSSEGLGTSATSALDLAQLTGPSDPKHLPTVWPLFAQIVLDFGAGVLLLGTFMSLVKRVDGSWQFPSTQVFLTGVGLVSIGLLLCRITSPAPTDRQSNRGTAQILGGAGSRDAVIMLQVFLIAASLGSAGWLLGRFIPPDQRARTWGHQPFNGSAPDPSEPPAPYGKEYLNFMYNLLFCDNPSLLRLRPADGQKPPPWAILLDDSSDPRAVQAFADDETEESRIRCLAFNWLRRNRHPVPKGRLLGTIVEVSFASGLDVIAAYADGRVRYINHTGKLAVFDGMPPDVAAGAKHLVGVSQPIVDRLNPWDKPRRPPPPKGNVRMTFLASDGLYFAEETLSAMERDPRGGEVYSWALRLLELINAAVIKKSR